MKIICVVFEAVGFSARAARCPRRSTRRQQLEQRLVLELSLVSVELVSKLTSRQKYKIRVICRTWCAVCVGT